MSDMYWWARLYPDRIEVQEGTIDNDQNVKIITINSQKEAQAYIASEMQKKKEYVASDLRIPDLFDLFFRDIEEFREGIKLLQKNGVTDIRKLHTYDEQTQQNILQKYGLALKYIPNPSAQLIDTAIRQNGFCIQHIDTPSSALQMQAVESNAMALQFIDEQTPELIACALENKLIVLAHSHIKNPSEETFYKLLERGVILGDLDTDLKNDKAFALHAIEARPKNYRDLPDELKKDEELALLCLKKDTSLMSDIDKSLLHSKSFVMQTIEYYPDVIGYAYNAHSDIVDDKEVMIKAVSSYSYLFEFASDRLKKDKDVLLEYKH